MVVDVQCVNQYPCHILIQLQTIELCIYRLLFYIYTVICIGSLKLCGVWLHQYVILTVTDKHNHFIIVFHATEIQFQQKLKQNKNKNTPNTNIHNVYIFSSPRSKQQYIHLWCVHFVIVQRQYIYYNSFQFAGVGKTSLVHLICHNEPCHNPSATIGCSVEVKVHFSLLSKQLSFI